MRVDKAELKPEDRIRILGYKTIWRVISIVARGVVIGNFDTNDPHRTLLEKFEEIEKL